MSLYDQCVTVIIPFARITNSCFTRRRGACCHHKCFCIEMCFVFLACLFRPSVAIRGLPQDMAVRPSRCPRRESPKNVNIKKYHRLVRFFADKYDGTEPIQIGKMKKSRIFSKVFPKLYIMLVVVPDEFDFSASRQGATSFPVLVQTYSRLIESNEIPYRTVP